MKTPGIRLDAGRFFLSDLAGPAEGVGFGAPLDAGEFVVELLGKGADLVVVDLVFLVAPGQFADGRDDGRRADAPCFLQRAAFRRLEQLVDAQQPLCLLYTSDAADD